MRVAAAFSAWPVVGFLAGIFAMGAIACVAISPAKAQQANQTIETQSEMRELILRQSKRGLTSEQQKITSRLRSVLSKMAA